MPGMRELTRRQLSLLLYLECRAVDNGGLVDQRYMNDEERAWASQWAKEGFIDYGRLKWAEVEEVSKSRPNTHYVRLSDEAFALAHAERKARARRSMHRFVANKEAA